MDDYLAGLDRAMKSMPANRETKDRFIIPSPKVFYEGKTTVLENFRSIADTLNRDPEHVMKYLLQEMGTAGKIEGPVEWGTAAQAERSVKQLKLEFPVTFAGFCFCKG